MSRRRRGCQAWPKRCADAPDGLYALAVIITLILAVIITFAIL